MAMLTERDKPRRGGTNREDRGARLLVALVVVFCLAAALPVWAQIAVGAIDGLVRDASGGVVPGASVELSSPAMIGGSRVTVTDQNGRYRFLRLPAGEYSVTFSLQGFGTVKHDGVVVNAAFTATINAALGLAAVEETVTVTGESPIVDVRSTTGQLVLDDSVIDALPSARNIFDMTKFITGASTSRPDVGGNTSIIYTSIHIHGNRSEDRGYYRDGVWLGGYFGGGDAPQAYNATGAQEEVTYQTTAIPAWVRIGGMAITMVSKSGGNDFGGAVYASGMNESMQSSNLDQDLEDQGVTATSGMKKAYDVDATFGGPIMQDKLWFFGSYRVYSVNTLRANQFFPEGAVFGGDEVGGQQLSEFVRKGQQDFKLTWQANPNNKFALAITHENSLRPTRPQGASFVEFEATAVNQTLPKNFFLIANYTGTVGASWLLEGSFSRMRYDYRSIPQDGQTGPPCLDFVNSILTCASIRHSISSPRTNAYHASATWLGEAAGSHELRGGLQGDFGKYITQAFQNGDTILRFRGDVPDSADLRNTPVFTDNRINNVGLYLQDRWQIGDRVTVNIGVRYDYANYWIAEQNAEAGTWVPARHSDEEQVLTWNNVVPRLGVAYDVFGTGRTVVKGSFSKYVGNEATRVQQGVNPLFTQSNRCAWDDLNGDRLATADELSRCRGFSGGLTTTLAPDLRRPFNNEYSLGFQHELAPNFALSVMYHRKENRDLRTRRNLAVPTSGYIPVEVMNPLTNQPMTIYNQDPATQGKQLNQFQNDSKLDNDYNGIEFTVERRFAGQAYLQAGYHYGKNLGRTRLGSDLNDPNLDIFTDGAVRFDEPHQFKVSGNILLPGEINLSGFLIARTGHSRQRSLSVGRSTVPDLTRSSQRVNLERNDDSRYNSVSLLDLRVGRVFQAGPVRLEPFLDLYNIFNANTILTQATSRGAVYGNVSRTINPRVIRIGAKLNF